MEENKKTNDFYDGKLSDQEEKDFLDQISFDDTDLYLSSLKEIRKEQDLQEIEENFLNSNSGGKGKLFYFYGLLAAAASLLLIFLISNPSLEDKIDNSNPVAIEKKKTVDELSQNERLAYHEAKQALALISNKMEVAQNQMNKLRMIHDKNPLKMVNK